MRGWLIELRVGGEDYVVVGYAETLSDGVNVLIPATNFSPSFLITDGKNVFDEEFFRNLLMDLRHRLEIREIVPSVGCEKVVLCPKELFYNYFKEYNKYTSTD